MVASLVIGGAVLSKQQQLEANKQQGRAFEEETKTQLEKKQTGVVEQLHVKTESGIRTILDFAGKEDGKTVLTEAKSSDTAPLSPNQKKAFPEIEKSGVTVVGQGRPGLRGGTKIEPTTVRVVRPPTPRR